MNIREKILYEKDAVAYLKRVLHDASVKKRKVFLLQDENTDRLCNPVLRTLTGESLSEVIPITIPAGESHKNLDSCVQIWKQLTDERAGRDALLVNLGGGVVTDLGGFAASCYKRGIATIHIPTSLLAMVDASIGGKTGVDFEFYKNHIGTFYHADAVLIITDFLKSLPANQLRSGFGEVLKYGLISSPELLNEIAAQQDLSAISHSLISTCVVAKTNITNADPFESGIRKFLNFGHTAGHALESYALQNGKELLHGEAVAAGMLIELWISVNQCGLNESVQAKYHDIYKRLFKKYHFTPEDIPAIVERAYHDKKNSGGSLNFVLLKVEAQVVYDVEVSEQTLKDALQFYLTNA